MEYKIQIENQYINVTEEVYKEYYRMYDRECYLIKRDVKNNVQYYNALDSESMNGEEIIKDIHADVLEKIVQKESNEMLYKALGGLKDKEKQVILEIYYNGKTEKQVADKIGISQQAVHKSKEKSLKKLKTLING